MIVSRTRRAVSSLGLSVGLCVVSASPIDAQISDLDTELTLGRMALSAAFEECPAVADAELQREINAFGHRLLEQWPTALKGYNYEFHVADCRMLNASAAPAGSIVVTLGMLEALDHPDQLAALLAHEIAHVEYRHGYRKWRNWRNRSAVLGIVSALGGSAENGGENGLAELLQYIFEGNLFSHSRDREREADLVASLYLHRNGVGDKPLRRLFEKLRGGDGGGGAVSTHPHIGERIARAAATQVQSFPATEVFHGLDERGELVASLQFDLQRQYKGELDVIATLSSTERLESRDNVNTMRVRAGGRKLKLEEWSAEQIEPQGRTTPIFRARNQRGFIGARIEEVDLKLRNVDRWVPAYTDAGEPTEVPFENVVFHGYDGNDAPVAELHLLRQRLLPEELHVTVGIRAMAALCEGSNCRSRRVDDLHVVADGRKLKLSPLAQLWVRPGGTATGIFRAKKTDVMIQGPVDSVELKLRNVERWESGDYVPASVGGSPVPGWVRPRQ